MSDFVAHSTIRYDELLSRPQAERVVVRSGRAIAATLPAYGELDDLVQEPTVLSDGGSEGAPAVKRGASTVAM